MGMTMTQKILANAAGKESVKAGELIMANLNLVLGNDITTPVAIGEFDKIGLDGVFDKAKVALVPDHFTPNKDIKSAQQALKVRTFAKEQDIVNYFEVGEVGIEHALLPEKGLVVAGDVVIGADSHTCTYGALGAFSTGVLILHIIGMIGVDGALYKSMEFTGEGMHTLTMDDRFSIANMAIEAGAKNGIFEVDDLTVEYMKDHSDKEYTVFDAEYVQTIDIDLATVPHTVAFPHLPENARTPENWGDVEIDQVVIGSCTNGRISDLRHAAEILKGKHVKKGIRVIVFPATQAIYLEALKDGTLSTLVEAGCVISAPTCGPCLGGHMGILAEGERCVSTTNRNFIGRMGHVDSEVYLASPEVAAASAVTGKITAPEEVM